MHLLGCGIGGYIKILGQSSEQQVAHGATYQQALEALAAQARHDLEGAVADVLPGNGMLIPGDDIQGDAFAADNPKRASLTQQLVESGRWQGKVDRGSSASPIQVSYSSVIVISRSIIVFLCRIRAQHVLNKNSLSKPSSY